MKTTQNNMWMRFLALGAFSLILFGFSCKKSEYRHKFEFYLINQTNHLIKLDYPSYQFTIEPGKTFVIKDEQDGGKASTAEPYLNNPIPNLLNIGERKVMIKIGNKCFVSTDNSEHSLINMKSYVGEKLGERWFKFTYTFTEADYERATACP